MLKGELGISSQKNMELIDITQQCNAIVDTAAITSGLLYLFNPHTTAGITINEGADPDVREDIITGFSALIPQHLDFKHAEGNSPSHMMASLVGSSLTLFIENRRIVLGRWQRIFFCEFDGPRTRNVAWRLSQIL